MPRAQTVEYLVPITIEPLEEGGFLATSRILQGLVAQGRTITETMEIAQDVARKLIESCLEHHDPLPKGLLKIDERHPKAQARVSVSVPA